jgi:hypothetical protein
MRLTRWQLRTIKPGTLIEISGERWGCVYHVPFGFPWLSDCVCLDTGWSIHRDHITRIGENALDRARQKAEGPR